jgi:hypothetical protein
MKTLFCSVTKTKEKYMCIVCGEKERGGDCLPSKFKGVSVGDVLA